MQRDIKEPPVHSELCVEELNIGLGGYQDSDGESADFSDASGEMSTIERVIYYDSGDESSSIVSSSDDSDGEPPVIVQYRSA